MNISVVFNIHKMSFLAKFLASMTWIVKRPEPPWWVPLPDNFPTTLLIIFIMKGVLVLLDECEEMKEALYYWWKSVKHNNHSSLRSAPSGKNLLQPRNRSEKFRTTSCCQSRKRLNRLEYNALPLRCTIYFLCIMKPPCHGNKLANCLKSYEARVNYWRALRLVNNREESKVLP